MEQRSHFGSRIGAMLATAGSAIGLGNIWRFPYLMGENGGGAFLLVYLLCLLFLGIPLMLSEFYIGRQSRKNAVGAFRVLAPGTPWPLVGYLAVLTPFLILGYYFVVAGWTLHYAFLALTGELAGQTPDGFAREFARLSTGGLLPIFWSFLFIVATGAIVALGVIKGIERFSRLLMPFFFLLLAVLGLRSLMLDGAAAGLSFLFDPDLRELTPAAMLSALGQSFLSLSIGMGILITYGSYFPEQDNLPRTACQVAALDTLVAVMAGVIIFPAVFSFGIAPTAGPALVFVALPNVFQQLPLSSLWGGAFYLLLALAALTSTISLHEVVTAYVQEEHRFSRRRAALAVSAALAVLAAACSLSLGPLSDHRLFGRTLFDLLDGVTGNFFLPLGGLLMSVFIGCRADRALLEAELTSRGTVPFRFFKGYVLIMKYVAPIVILLIFLEQIGLLAG